VCDLLRVRDLLASGASPNARDDEGRPPLVSAILGNSVALVGLLLESKADVNATDPHGWTPLHFAAEEALPQMATLLVAKGADANIKDDEGNTALHRAVFSARGRDEIVRLLRKHGAKDDVKNKAGETPKSLAERLGETMFTTEDPHPSLSRKRRVEHWSCLPLAPGHGDGVVRCWGLPARDLGLFGVVISSGSGAAQRRVPRGKRPKPRRRHGACTRSQAALVERPRGHGRPTSRARRKPAAWRCDPRRARGP
jgi:hypothetical protein